MQLSEDETLSAQHHERLVASGVDPAVLTRLKLHRATEGLPERWHDQDNALYVEEGVIVPAPVLELLVAYGCSEAVVVVATVLVDHVALLVEGARPTIFLGPETYVQAGEIFCGAGSSIVLNGIVSATGRVVVDARNGGTILAAEDQLWAANVYLATDDMHRLEDLATGVRLNPFGGHIRLGRHVWLGRDVVLTGDVDLGDGCVVGLGSYVRSEKVAANTAVAGTPARVIREGVVWRQEDTP